MEMLRIVVPFPFRCGFMVAVAGCRRQARSDERCRTAAADRRRRERNAESARGRRTPARADRFVETWIAAPVAGRRGSRLPSGVRALITSTAKRLLLVLPLALAACDGSAGAPTKSDIKHVVQERMQRANQETSNNTLGLFSGPYDPADLDITGADCSAKDNGVYSCAVTAVTKKGTNTAQLAFKKVNGAWQLVQ
jgi:hypothetical protein